MSNSKVPASWPTWKVKCMWRSTALVLKIRAKSEDHAKEMAEKQVRKMDGGLWCEEVKVLGTI